MSHFSTIRTALKDRESLIAGLRQTLSCLFLNQDDAQLQQSLDAAIAQYDHPVPLESGYSDEAEAEIIIKQRAIRFHSDIGFRLNQATGVYELVADDYRYSSSTLARHYSTLQAFQNQVQVNHDIHYTIAQTTALGYVVQDHTVNADGSVRLVVVGGA